MRSAFCIVFVCLCGWMGIAQNGFADILAAGIEAANKYSNDYTRPAAEAFTFNLGSGWYDDGHALKPGKFTIQIKAQGTFAPDEKKSFLLSPQAYEQIIQDSYDASNNPPGDISVTFGDGSNLPRLVATALGQNDPDQQLVISSRDATTGLIIQEDRITLAQGLGSTGLDIVPSVFLQGGIGLGAGLELKARFIPKIQTDEVETGLYGAGLQWELTQLILGEQAESFPVAGSVLVGYSRLDATYDFEDGLVVDGSDQRIESKANSFSFAAIASTNFKVFNLYGGLNYVTGTTQTDLLGTYTFRSSTVFFPVAATVEDPLSISTDVSGALGTIGAKLTLGAFNLNADFTFGEYSTASASLFLRI
ncbi:DUF6588 family protein [Nonlabens xiamenensis]|uniref:DUF6588 family protein n=1 Tax=Nonlabens xiamenensis TaxID=2341043 RepID=UPI000F608C8B|nr:DUF6588 family protein [Nonlabens xiamenensis]